MISQADRTELDKAVRKHDTSTLWQYEVNADLFGSTGSEIRQYVLGQQIRQMVRKAGQSTRQGTLVCLDGRNVPELWTLLGGHGEGETTGIMWRCRQSDQLRNIYVQF